LAEGIRIRPRAELGWPDGALVVVVDHNRPTPPPTDGTPIEKVKPVCSLCQVQHFAKAYHIQLRAGSAIVSTGVWESLQRIADNPFEYANPVPAPPGQIISPNTNTPIRLVEKFVMPITTTN
jgi:hypothetical protein